MSSNKTANLQLNQWQAGDAFLREEFNQDNGKIDAAVQGAKDAAGAAVNAVKLLDMTTQTAMQKINIDVSGLNLTAYREVKLWVENAVAASEQSIVASMLLNNIAGKIYDHSNGNYADKTDAIAAFRIGRLRDLPGHIGGCLISFKLLGGVLVAENLFVSQEDYGQTDTATVRRDCRSISPILLKPEDLTSIQMTTNPPTAINAGLHITIAGIKL